MADEHRKKLRLTTIIYWVLLVYIIAALLWWLFSLLTQNQDIYQLKKHVLSGEHSPAAEMYRQQISELEQSRRRDNTKYIGEGITFLVLILFGAVYIYRSVRKQFRLQQQQQNFMMASTIGDSFYIIDDGRTVSNGSMNLLREDEEMRRKYLGIA